MGHLTEAQYRIIADRMIEEHRKYGNKLRPGHWADVAARKVASHIDDFREGERVFTKSEVRELIRGMIELLEGDPKQVLAAIEAVNAKHGLGLSDPA